MEHSTRSSKVTVEYTDPSGIYPVISGDLQRHLPLRNLYWNSASRPLRSIASLHINLVQAGTNLTAPSAAEPYHSSTRNGDLGTETSNGASRGGNQRESGTGAKKERRHQIPGLRQTPYLKIFFLRCSDVESYRATHRAQIREWIKENTPPSQSTASLNAQEFHDAFEWLIVHIVLPDDGRAISHPSNTSKSDVRNGFRGSDAVIDKVRADFNGTSKSAIDRVAQVRIQRNAEDVSIPRQDQDPSAGWSDFILKAKSLILSSFDLRVTQYEEDIKERDAQRNIPGWNFNTFFVLKEGLARGFESVGLIEDALTGYRELAAGLDSILEDDENRREQHDHFRDHTDDIALELKRALQADQVQPLDQVNGSTADLLSQDGHDLGSDILDTDRKPFRDLILANDISVFDFRCYLFAREVALLLRLANVSGPTGSESRTPAMFMDKDSTDPSLQATSPDTQHLLLLAEVCRRALDFFASGSRLLRDDLRSSIDPLSKVHATPDISNFSSFEGSIEDLVASWTYSACQCIIDVTNIPSLADRCQTVLRTIKPSDETSGGGRGSAIAAISQEELPRRTSSLPVHAKPSPRFSVPDRPSAINSSDAMRPLPPTSPQTGTQDLAAQRAELVTLKRRVLATVGRRSSCIRVVDAILPSSLDSSITDMEDVPLDDATSIRDDLDNGEGGLNGPGVNSLRNRDLRRGLSTGDAYSKAYEELTITALALNIIGEKRRSVESLTADLGLIRYRAKDYGSAASYLHQTANFYRNNDWTRLEIPMLDMYAQSLKHLDRKADFIRIGLQILARITTQSRKPYASINEKLLQEFGHLAHYLQDTILASRSLERSLSAPLDRYFGEVFLDPYIHHFKSQDGFYMSLNLESLMPQEFEADGIRVELVSVGEEQRSSISLTTDATETLQRGPNQVYIQATMTCAGWYRLERVEVRSAKISFVYDTTVPESHAFSGAPPIIDDADHLREANSTPILVWPAEEALQARISLCASIHLGQPKLLEVRVMSGQNDIDQGRINLRACSAGLRLRTAQAEVVSGTGFISDKSQAGSLAFGALEPRTEFTVRVPYGLETDLTNIKVKAEIFYAVAGKNYLFVCNDELSIRLSLSVNVQDVFQERALFSNFKIGAANLVPARIKDYHLHSAEAYQVAFQPLSDMPLEIFPRQPLSLVAKIQRQASGPQHTSRRISSDSMLTLRIWYACLDQEISTAIEDALSTALKESRFHSLSYLLLSASTKTFLSKMSAQDLELIGLLHEIHILPFEECDWGAVLAGLPPEKATEVQSWLTEWHMKHATIKLPKDIDTRNVLELIVPVEIPQIPVVITARLDVHGCMIGPGEAFVAVVDEPLLAEASLRCSSSWGNDTDPPSKSDIFDVTYEFQANQDIWLMGGQQKGHYSVQAGETRKFPILLLPQKPGYLQYPSLDVRTARVKAGDKRRSGDTTGVPKEVVACEIDYLDQGESILVIPNLNSSTVSLDSDSPGDEALLLESRSR